jgi:hypothetical protein
MGTASADMPNDDQSFSLIVNADDYGYSEGVSRGILDMARKGIVTATGVLANSPFFDEHVTSLLSVQQVDAGVHLNLTFGRPLTARLAALLGRYRGEFPRKKYGLALSILSGSIAKDVVEEEWDAQIRRCLEAGLRLWFLNSHEHLHMLPPLYRMIGRLADRHGIPYIRHTRAEWFGFPTMGSLVRNSALQVLDWVNWGGYRHTTPYLLGASKSGKLDLNYLEKRIASLRPGHVYELMCHPGYSVDGESIDPHLQSFHDWEGEIYALICAENKGIFRRSRIGYRNMGSLGNPANGSHA